MRPPRRSHRTPPRLLVLGVLALVPILVLFVLAWLGARAQRDAAIQSARREAAAAAVLTAEWLATALDDAIESAPLIDDPPRPRPDATLAALDVAGDDPAALRTLRDDPDAGFSPAGLPVRVLAGLRVWEMTRQPDDAAVLANLAASDAASAISPAVFDRLGDVSRAAQWRTGERVRAIIRNHPDIDAEGRWRYTPDGWLWLAQTENHVRFVDAEPIERIRPPVDLPAWATWRVAWHGRSATDDGDVLASRAIAFAGAPRVEIIERRPGLVVEAAVRGERRMLWLLAATALCVIGALAAIGRSIARERQLGELKSRFVSSVSHELRAPVGSIRLMAEALHQRRVAGDTAAEFHRLIAGESARLGHLIENVLDLTRIDEGRKSFVFEETDLAPLVRDAVRLIEPIAAERAISLTTECADFTASVDAAAIHQALVNLLDNAVKFSPEGSTVSVILDGGCDGGGWSLRVCDDGPGVPPAERERIFERFHRLGNELRRETQGCGIGLAIVRAIADAHQARTGVTARASGGSEFFITHP